MALPKIPINARTLAKAGQLFESELDSDTTIEVLIEETASRRLVTLCRRVLAQRPGSAELTVSSFSTDMPTLNKDADLTIVIAGSSPYLKRIMEIALWSGMNCVVLTEDATALIATVPEEDALEIAKTIIEVDVQKPQEILERDLAKWCINRMPEHRLSLGVAFPFMRQAIAQDFSRQTSLENAVIAAVFFLPGADLPILTLNQCKLLYQIAVINEVPLSRERLADVALIVISAFGLRGLTRYALRKLGPVGWLVRGTVSFGATMAVGHLANELYCQGGGVMELVNGKLDQDAILGDEELTTVDETPANSEHSSNNVASLRNEATDGNETLLRGESPNNDASSKGSVPQSGETH